MGVRIPTRGMYGVHSRAVNILSIVVCELMGGLGDEISVIGLTGEQ